MSDIGTFWKRKENDIIEISEDTLIMIKEFVDSVVIGILQMFEFVAWKLNVNLYFFDASKERLELGANEIKRKGEIFTMPL